MRRICSVGYEGLALEDLIDLLTGAQVAAVVDVRLSPVSRRPGFSRRRLEAALGDAGIAYVHEKTLGNPVDNRERLRTGDPAARERMRAIVDDEGAAALARVTERARTERVALLCVERDHDRCHRAFVADAVAARDPAIEVVAITGPVSAPSDQIGDADPHEADRCRGS